MVPAVRRGSSATCAVAIPFAWPLLTPALDSVGLSYTVTAQSLPLTRESVISLPSIRVPANGSSTTENVKTVL